LNFGFSYFFNGNPQIFESGAVVTSAVPELSTWAMMVPGFLGLGLMTSDFCIRCNLIVLTIPELQRPPAGGLFVRTDVGPTAAHRRDRPANGAAIKTLIFGLIFYARIGTLALPQRLLGAGQQQEFSMATQIVMERAGDRRHQFDPQDAGEVADAEKRFQKLTGKGFTAAVRTTDGEIVKIASFDPTARETVFFPRLVGG
jgi:hypothetical protein